MAYNIGPTIAVNGEKEYTAAMKNVKQQMVYVKAAAAEATSAYAANDKSVAALTARNKGLNDALSLQKQAVQAAEDALQRMRDEGVDPSSAAYQRMTANLNNAKAAVGKTTVEIKQNEDAIAAQAEEAERAAKAQEEYRDALTTVGSAADKIATTGLKVCLGALAAIATAAVAGTKALLDMAGASADVADELLTTSAQTGVSTEFLQEYAYAARFIDTELETLTGSMAKNIKSMKAAQDGTKLSVEAYEKLGVAVVDADGYLRDSDTVYWEVIDALGGMANETERDAIAMQLLGRSAQQVNPLIQAGSGAVEEYAQQAHELGLVLDDEAIAALGRYDDALETLSAQSEGLKNMLSAEFADSFTYVAQVVSDSVKKMSSSMKRGELKASIDKIKTAIEKAADKMADFAKTALPKLADGIAWVVENGGELVSVLVGATTGFATFKAAMGGFTVVKSVTALISALTVVTTGQTVATEAATVAQTGLNAAMAANPIGIVVAAAAALVAGLVALCAAMKATSGENGSLAATIADTAADIEASREAHQQTAAAIDDEERSTQGLVKQLEKLADKTSRSAAENAEMQGIIDELNGRVEGLNLAYDENTGALNRNITAIEDMVQARYKEAKADAIIQRQIELLDDVATAQDTLTAAQEAQRIASANLTAAQERYDAALAAGATGRNLEVLAGAVAGYESALGTATGNVDAAQAAVDGLTTEYDENQVALDGLMGAVDEAASGETIERFIVANYDLTDAIAAAGISAETAQAKIDGYAGYTQNAFERISEAAELTVDDLIDNLTENQAAIEEWSENLAGLGDKIDAGLLQVLRDMGPEYAGTVANIADATPEELAALNTAWENGGSEAVEAFLAEIGAPEMVNSGADTVEEIAAGMEESTKLDDAVVTVVGSAKAALEGAIDEANFGEYGKSISYGIADGITAGTGAVASAVEAVVRAALDAAQTASDTHSPSRLFRDKIGKMWAAGIDVGFSDEMQSVTASVGSEIRKAIGNIAGGLTVKSAGATSVTINVTNPSEAWLDYAFKKFNMKLGAAL